MFHGRLWISDVLVNGKPYISQDDISVGIGEMVNIRVCLLSSIRGTDRMEQERPARQELIRGRKCVRLSSREGEYRLACK